MDLYDWVGGGLEHWDCRNVVAESGIIDLTYEDTKEGGRLFVWVWLKLGLDLDDKRGTCGPGQHDVDMGNMKHTRRSACT